MDLWIFICGKSTMNSLRTLIRHWDEQIKDTLA
jgi:hypothetical protein